MNLDFEEFRALADRGNLIPLFEEIVNDLETPVSAYLKLSRKPSFLLESVEGGEKWARYSFIGIDPLLTLTCHGKQVTIASRGDIAHEETDNPMGVVERILSRFRPVPVPGLPRFSGGFVGYVGYDVVKSFERVPDRGKPGTDAPDIFLMLTDTIVIFDSLRQTVKVVNNVHTEGSDLRTAYDQACQKIREVVYALRSGRVSGYPGTMPKEGPSNIPLSKDLSFTSNFTEDAFCGVVERAKEYIMSGDVVQVVLSQRFETRSAFDPLNVYRTLRLVNPSPYMYYIETGEMEIVGSSPEILVRLDGDRITLRPIAGTRKRGMTEEEDRALEEDLRNDPKEIAEHIMLVDLGRNDVGRVAAIGSVKVKELMTIERYSHVMHLVSNVEGTLRKGLNAFDVFRSCFPAGTVTGAPKVRAMEIIEELEPTRRGPYAGAVGYFDFSGNMDTCITIRTLVFRDGKVHVQAGAGLVADSVPASEYRETVNKATAMMKALEGSRRIFS